MGAPLVIPAGYYLVPLIARCVFVGAVAAVGVISWLTPKKKPIKWQPTEEQRDEEEYEKFCNYIDVNSGNETGTTKKSFSLKQYKESKTTSTGADGYESFCVCMDENAGLPPGTTKHGFPKEQYDEAKYEAKKISHKRGYNHGETTFHSINGIKRRPNRGWASKIFLAPDPSLLLLTDKPTSEFLGFVGTGRVNQNRVGLQHTLFRHGNQFREMLGYQSGLSNRVMELIKHMERLPLAKHMGQYDRIHEAIKASYSGNNGKSALEEAQIRLAELLYNILKKQNWVAGVELPNGRRLDLWCVPRVGGGSVMLITVFGERNEDGTRTLITSYIVEEMK